MEPRDLHPRRFFLCAWRDFDEEAGERLASSASGERGSALITAYIFSVVTVSLILQEYLGNTDTFVQIVHFIDNPLSQKAHPLLYSTVGWLRPAEGTFGIYLVESGYYELWIMCYWASWRILGFLFIPLVAVALHPGLRKMPLGLSVKGISAHLWIYAVLFLPVLAAVFIVSFFEEFQVYYPFYSEAHRSKFDFIVWESFYMAQFLSLEFFFRGFMIQPLRKTMGSSAIFAMMIPYVMIHIGKPMIECFAAIIAGIVLGTLALKTRSIWAGFLIHVSVALSMDLLAIWQKL